MRYLFTVVLFFTSCLLFSQTNAVLTHDVYDGWKSAGERAISNDGNYVVYTINEQEGDGIMYIQNLSTNVMMQVPRGYNAVITNDSKYVIFKIKPSFAATRQARIKKVKPDDLPKDSLGMVTLGSNEVQKVARLQSYKTPQKGVSWLAYKMEKALADTASKKKMTDSLKLKIDNLTKLADSVIRRSIDSVKGNIEREEVIKAAQKAVKEIYKKAEDLLVAATDAEGDELPAKKPAEGTDLVLKNLYNNSAITFTRISDYIFDEKGTRLVMKFTANAKDSNSRGGVIVYDLQRLKTDTIAKGLNDAKNFSFSTDGSQLAFVAEKDSSSKALLRFFKLYHYTAGADSAMVVVQKFTAGMPMGTTVSEEAELTFSEDGSKLFFGTAAIARPKDTSLVDFELARLDVWHYNDDYLQPQQLKQLTQELNRSYTAVLYTDSKTMRQLANDSTESVSFVDEGNANWMLTQSTKGNRIALQWEGRLRNNAYVTDVNTGTRKLVVANNPGNFRASPKGKFVYWYDPVQKNYFTYAIATGKTVNITEKISEPLYDLENDVPDYASPSGSIGWIENDNYFLVKSSYDVWRIDPTGNSNPVNITNGFGKKNSLEFDYVNTDRDKKFINSGETIVLRALQKTNKHNGFYSINVNEKADPALLVNEPMGYGQIVKAKDAAVWLVQRSTIAASELYSSTNLKSFMPLTAIADQQKKYNWLSAELVRWKMFDGKMSEGILYKPANFDSTKKYPVIFYFYERDADGLYNYRAPAPSASTINIPYFVSNGYLVFDPNIYYKDGQPGESAYNSVVSAAKYLGKNKWVDSTRMAIQGQSWGGYQVAYLVTRTNMFRAAGAGAPVANMTSAYGGIRWGTGINRQFQYEKTQSRIGATLWQKPDLYLKNSPLFAADKINTPLLIMHNDADGSVPWYQGIELFTALRRLNKKVWMLQYNGEDHNLVQRKNRKDLSVRLAQFFDYYLKDAKPAMWIQSGVPATLKGVDWGLGAGN